MSRHKGTEIHHASLLIHVHFCECTKGIQLQEVRFGNGAYNVMPSYTQTIIVAQTILVINNPLRPCAGIVRRTKVNGVLRNFADSNK